MLGRKLIAVPHIESSIRMEPNSSPIDIFPRIEPEELRERRNALKLKTCPFCGGTVAPRWAHGWTGLRAGKSSIPI